MSGLQTDEDSPYHALRRDTCIFYSRYIKALIATAGHIYLSKITGRDVRRWHAEWTEKMGARSAYGCVQTLRRVIHYGCELRNRDAIELAQVLSKTRFSAPRGRKKRPTYEQIKAFRQAAHKAGRASIALAITLQFDLHLRQKDVIGEWTSRGQGLEGWEWGLTWSHIDAANILRKPTSKSNGQEVAEHDLKLYPDVLAELPERGLGPIVVDEHTGLPWSAAHFRRQCKKIAKAAGWPEGLWNMDARAGAISEALDAGADLFDVMSAATHTQLTTTRGYNRERVEQTSRVARLRLEKRHKPGTDEP